jgi:hypothetical protein
MVTDICMTTRNRIEYLKETVDRLFACTRLPFALHVIDDGSEDGATVPYLLRLFGEGRLASLTLRKERVGHPSGKNLSTWLAFSNPFVITADDILCPDVEPDWLARGLVAMAARPKLAELDLNHPGAYRIALEDDGEVVYCRAVGGTFGFLRREFVEGFHVPHILGDSGYIEDTFRCDAAQASGWRVGFLKHTYCYHIGRISVARPGQPYIGPFVEPQDWKTLEPPGGYSD